MNGDIHTTISFEDDTEVEVTVTYCYTPGSPGRMYLRNGDPGYPPEPEEVEITEIEDSEGVSYNFDDLNVDDQDRIMGECYEDAKGKL